MINLAVGIAIGYVLGRYGKYIKVLAGRGKSLLTQVAGCQLRARVDAPPDGERRPAPLEQLHL
jgi:hypothetical protein